MFPAAIKHANRDYFLVTDIRAKQVSEKTLQAAARRLALEASPPRILSMLEDFIRANAPVSGTNAIRGAFGQGTKMGRPWIPFFGTLLRRGSIARYKANNKRNLYVHDGFSGTA
jgi:hypothetical protein